MQLERILRAVHSEPWLITPRAHSAIKTLLENKLSASADAIMASIPIDMEEDDGGMPTPQMPEGVAYIPVMGVIGKRMSMIEKMCMGGVDCLDVADMIEECVADPKIRAILLHIDSPGGTVGGVPELGNTIASASMRKPCLAYADGLCASAAYWLAAGASAIWATPSAEVGSIGVYLPWVDETQALAMQGIKVDLIKNADSPLKGAGYPGTALSPEQRADWQAGVDHIGANFKSHIRMNRPQVKDEALTGTTFFPDEAQALGLIDGVGTLQQALAALLR